LSNSVQRALQDQKDWKDFNLLALTLLVRGPTWTPSASATVIDILSLDSLVNHRDELSMEGKAILLNVWIKVGPYSSITTSIATSLVNALRITGRTAYLVPSGTNEACSLKCQAFALLGFLNLPSIVPATTVEKLANIVAEGFALRPFVQRSFEDVVRMIALATYDKMKRSTAPDARVEVRSEENNLILMKESFVGPEGLVKYATNTFSLSLFIKSPVQTPTPITFKAEGSGELSVALGYTFCPALISTKPKYFGLYVEKVVRLLRTGEELKPLQGKVKAGDALEILISVTTRDDANGLILEDLLPGGLEAVDPNIPDSAALFSSSTSDLKAVLVENPWSAFESKEVKEDRVVCAASFLYAGTHVCRYYANAITSGTFVVPAAKGYLAKQPEVMGLSASDYITVLPIAS
jgi:hypothetical protein